MDSLDKNCFEYISNFLSQEESKELFDYLLENIPWEEREITVYGKKVMQPRLVCWIGDKDYTYSFTLFKKREFPEKLLELKTKIEEFTKSEFNSCLLNLYRDENDYAGMHSDDEKSLGNNPKIASISLGETREFIIESRFDKSKNTIELENGSLLFMFGDCQKTYRHGIKKSKDKTGVRINLTFRYVY